MSKLQLLKQMKSHKAYAIGGALMLSAIASTAEAATFNVEYTGTVKYIEKLEPCTSASCIGLDPSIYYTPLDSFVTRNGDTVALRDRIVGSYTIDDTAGITDNRFRFIGQGDTNGLDPSQPSALDTTLDSATGDTESASFVSSRRPGFDAAFAETLSDSERALYLSRFSLESETLTINEESISPNVDFPFPFSYSDFFRGPPAPGLTVIRRTAFGSLEQFNVIEVSTPTVPTTPPETPTEPSEPSVPPVVTPPTPTNPSEPASVPEPAVLFGLVAFGLGLGTLRGDSARERLRHRA